MLNIIHSGEKTYLTFEFSTFFLCHWNPYWIKICNSYFVLGLNCYRRSRIIAYLSFELRVSPWIDFFSRWLPWFEVIFSWLAAAIIAVISCRRCWAVRLVFFPLNKASLVRVFVIGIVDCCFETGVAELDCITGVVFWSCKVFCCSAAAVFSSISAFCAKRSYGKRKNSF